VPAHGDTQRVGPLRRLARTSRSGWSATLDRRRNGILVLLKPRYAAYIVAAWPAGIVINLFSYGEWYDVGVRDLGLMGAALFGTVATEG
jgi:hypothetical protein